MLRLTVFEAVAVKTPKFQVLGSTGGIAPKMGEDLYTTKCIYKDEDLPCQSPDEYVIKSTKSTGTRTFSNIPPSLSSNPSHAFPSLPVYL